MRSLAFAAVLLTLAAACNSATDLKLDRPTPVPVNDRVPVAGAPLAVRFVGVSGDSRCPRNAMCVWAGDAVAQVDLVAPGDSLRVALHTNAAAGPTTATFHDYAVQLVSLEPVPEAGREIDPARYVAMLRVSRN